MDNIQLTAFIFTIIDIAIIAYVASIIYGFIAKKIYGLGRWYYKASEKRKYWQVITGFILLAITTIYLRFWVLGPRLLE